MLGLSSNKHGTMQNTFNNNNILVILNLVKGNAPLTKKKHVLCSISKSSTIFLKNDLCILW